jgi:hypothetical protein
MALAITGFIQDNIIENFNDETVYVIVVATGNNNKGTASFIS